MLPTAAIPVIAHNTTVSQNGPVMEINACRTAASFGLSEEDAAVADAAEARMNAVLNKIA